jgi:cell division protein ZapE
VTLTQRLHAELSRRGSAPDAAQLAAARYLESLSRGLEERRGGRSLLARLTGRRQKGASPLGAYLWGGVGRGKTLLLDSFAAELRVPFRRAHFHRFMQDVHARLNRLRSQHVANPLTSVATEMSADIDVLLFDELFVTDIADAMILAGLFGHLIDDGVVLVFTSNAPPEELYPGGLQRARFLPTIELLQMRTTVIEVDAGVDYRLRLLQSAPLLIATSVTSDVELARRFEEIADGQTSRSPLEIEGRSVSVLRRAAGVAWFDFQTLCEGPRATADYIEIGRMFSTVILSAVPMLGADENAARRFIALIDELYERGVKLIASTAAPIDRLYTGERLQREYLRTASRLHEMQSLTYLGRPHRP